MRYPPVWLALAGVLLAPPTHAQAWREVMALGKLEPTVLRDNGVEAQIDSVTVTSGGEETTSARVTVKFPDQEPIDLPPDPLLNDAYPLSVGVGALGPGPANPAVIVEGYSGGAHCCATFQMAVMIDGAILILGLPAMDGSPGTGFPADIDGDGMADIRRTDDAFLYSFSSYAASVAVPTIWNLREGKLIDVSAEPRFAPVYRELADSALAACADKEASERNGACAAYAAARARLGQAEDGIAVAVRDAAPSDAAPFEPALRRLLKDRGYLDPPPPPPPAPSSEPPVDSPAPVLHQEGVGPAEVPAPQEPGVGR